MYLHDFKIQNIKCFEDIHLPFPHEGDDYSGWTVLLGGNGSGKSTLLQAMGIALVGPTAAQRLLPDVQSWVRKDQDMGEFSARIIRGAEDGSEGEKIGRDLEARFAATGRQDVTIDGKYYDQPQVVQRADDRTRNMMMKSLYSSRKHGWFSCGYGPFRRMSEGSEAAWSLMNPDLLESRFATLFREDAVLRPPIVLLPQLYRRSLDPSYPDREAAGEALEMSRRLVDNLLPGGVKISRVDTEIVYFQGPGGAEVTVFDLSDGYRTFLALTIDIVYALGSCFEDLYPSFRVDGETLEVLCEGVILIDEVDAHLHPSWQRELGFRLRRTFPRIQFIVSSHSPFVAQAATDGGLIVLRPSGPQGTVRVERPVESVKGWRVDQILTSPLFGLDTTRDEETESLIRAHADLVAKRTWGKLSAAEKKQLARLEESLADRLTAPGESIEEREQQAEMSRYIAETLGQLGNKP
jgi:energy-coupling factor transporter ATP-binding protein EcfA2